MEPFATVEELVNRLPWVLDDDELRLAATTLEDASDLARGYGREWPDPETAPRLVRTLVLAASKRHMNNPEAYIQSRAGDETLIYTDQGEEGGSVSFNAGEIALLQELAGKSTRTLQSVPMTAWGPTRRHHRGLYPAPGEHGYPGYVPVYVGGKPFPMFPSEHGSW